MSSSGGKMKILTTLAILLIFACVGVLGEGGCVKCPPQDQVLPHPTRCSSYIRCVAGHAQVLSCPAGQVFDRGSLRCRSLHHAKCVEEPGPRDLVSCPSDFFKPRVEERNSGSLSTSGSCAQNCSSYQPLSEPYQHSVCAGEASTCLDDLLGRGLGIQDEYLVVAKHNSLRQRVALGLENGSALNHNLPKAANMRAMVWNGELAKVAQALADSCSDYGDCSDCRLITSRQYMVGQNSYWVWTTTADQPNLQAVVERWYSQVQVVAKEDWLSSFTYPEGVDITDFTQVIWADTYEVGCGWTAVSRSSWVSHTLFCNYGSTGNLLGEAVYEFGEAGSRCAEGMSTLLPGLCQPPQVVDPCQI